MDPQSPHLPTGDRYERMPYAPAGRTGLKLPRLSLGLWQNFGDFDAFDRMRATLRAAFDCGVNLFDLANNYGPPGGAAEENFARILHKDFAGFRDELFIATKAGHGFWPGPFGRGGSRKHLVASLDQSLRRLGLDYVDLYYHHIQDLETPLEHSLEALTDLVRSGKALYIGLSNYHPDRARLAIQYLAAEHVPVLLYQGCHNLLDRHAETNGMTTLLDDCGVGYTVFSPLAQGLLTDKYLDAIPAGSRLDKPHGLLTPAHLTPALLAKTRALNALAQQRGQSLATMALQWLLHKPVVTSILVGASSPQQIQQSVGAVQSAAFTPEELAAIDRICLDS